jgi:hypothetical protein
VWGGREARTSGLKGESQYNISCGVRRNWAGAEGIWNTLIFTNRTLIQTRGRQDFAGPRLVEEVGAEVEDLVVLDFAAPFVQATGFHFPELSAAIEVVPDGRSPFLSRSSARLLLGPKVSISGYWRWFKRPSRCERSDMR